MPLKVFDQILYHSLRPWQLKHPDQYFLNIIRTNGFATQKQLIQEFESALKETNLFTNEELKYNDFEDYNFYPVGKIDLNINEHLVDCQTEEYYNPFSSFYYHLINNEAIRFLHHLIKTMNREIEDNDRNYIISELSIPTIKAQLKDCAELIKVYASNENIVYALQVLKSNLIAILKSIELLYDKHIQIKITDTELYKTILKEEKPKTTISELSNYGSQLFETLNKIAGLKNTKEVDLFDQANSSADAIEFLQIFSGNNLRGDKIMSDANFEKLIGYTSILISTKQVPKNIEPVPKLNLPNQKFISRIFYELHKVQKISNKDVWVEFILQVFSQFSNTDKTTLNSNFSQKPAHYNQDLTQMKKNLKS